MKKKSLALIVVASLMIASIATALTLAYFTDAKTATNTFTVGNVEIDLEEPNWQQPGVDDKVKINPGVPVDKDPFVTNTGANDAYVRVKVILSNASAFKAAAAKYSITDLDTIFGGHNSGGKAGAWARANIIDNTAANTLTYVYNYNETLAKDDETNYVFTTVTLPSVFDNEDLQALEGTFNIKVVAEAIQTDGFLDAAAAFAALDAQLLTP